MPPATDARIRYRDLRPYKYQLAEEYRHVVDVRPAATVRAPGDFVVLDAAGQLTVKAGYAWDGPSGPTIDTRTFMRGSLVHDALYQLMREGLLGQEHRERADRLLREICLADGMNPIRAWWVYRSVRAFGGSHARPRPSPPPEIHTAP